MRPFLEFFPTYVDIFNINVFPSGHFYLGYTGWAKKNGPFFKCITLLYNDISAICISSHFCFTYLGMITISVHWTC